MIIFPAIDLRKGKCVRLVEGKLSEETIFSDNPVKMAQKWAEQGAEFLHVVDLDGAFGGWPENLEVVGQIVKEVKIPIQFGGGVRSLDIIEMVLAMGVERVILGTAVVSNQKMVEEACAKYGEKIVVGLDARSGMIASHGWEVATNYIVKETAKQLQNVGVKRIIYTDISRDGTMQGASIESTRELAKYVDMKIIASGGISSIEDIRALKELEQFGVEGAITGKAIYTGALDLSAAIALAKGEAGGAD